MVINKSIAKTLPEEKRYHIPIDDLTIKSILNLLNIEGTAISLERSPFFGFELII